MAVFWLGVLLSSALLVYSGQGAEHLKQLHCKPKPGCTLAKCDPMPDRWSMIGGLNPPSHEYPILCQNDEDSSCCEKFEEMKSENKRDLLKLELRLEMTEKREAGARLEIALLENEKSEIKKEVENLKRESTAIKRAADEKIALLEREQSEMKEDVTKLEKETRTIRRTADGNKKEIAHLEREQSEMKAEVTKLEKETGRTANGNKKELQTRIESIEKMVTQLISKQTVPQINPTDPTVTSDETTAKSGMEPRTIPCHGVLIERKCYFAVIHKRIDVHLSVGDQLCGDSGGKPANILNVGHQNAVENYIRGRGWTPAQSYIWLWTAMTYNTRQLQSSSGASRSLRWRSRYPSSKSTWTAVKMYVQTDATSSENGIYNHPPSGIAYGFICEI